MTIALLALVALILTPILVLALLLATSWGTRAVVNGVLAAVNPWPETTLRAAGARAGIWGGVELRGLRLTARDGRVMVAVDTIAVRYAVPELIRSPLTLRAIDAAGPAIVTRQLEDGRFDLLAPFLGKPSKPEKGGAGIRIERIAVRRGSIEAHRRTTRGVDSLAITDLAAVVSELRTAGGTSLALDTLGARLRMPGGPREGITFSSVGALAPDSLSLRRVSLDSDSTRVRASALFPIPALARGRFDGLRVRAEASPLAARDIAAMTGRRPPGDLRAVLEADGVDSTLDARLEARGLGGGAAAQAHVVMSGTRPVAVKLNGSATAVDFGSFIGDSAGRSVLNARADIDIRGPEPARLDGPARLVLDGTRVSGIMLEQARLDAHFVAGQADLVAEGRTAEATLGVRGTMSPFGAPARYELHTTLELRPAAPVAGDRDSSARAAPVFAGVVETWVVGEGWGPASARVRLTATPAADSVGVIGPSELDAQIHYTPADSIGTPVRLVAEIAHIASVVAGHTIERGTGRIESRGGRLDVDVHAVADGASVDLAGVLGPTTPWRDARATLRFRDLDLAKVSGDTLIASDLAGRIEAHLTAPEIVRLFASSGQAKSPWSRAGGEATVRLDPSGWRDQRVEEMTMRAALARGLVSLDARIAATFGRARLECAMRPFDAMPSLERAEAVLDDLDVGSALGVAGQHTALTGRVTASAAGRDSATLRADANVVLDGSQINRQHFERLRLTAAIGDTALDARLDARSGSDSARVAISAAPALDPARATIAGASQFDTLDSLLALDVRNTGFGVSFRATFTRPPGPRPRPLSAEAQIDGWVRAGQCRLDTLALVAKLADGALDVSRLTAVGTAFALEGAGRLALTHSASGVSDFRLGGQMRDVSTLAPVVRVSPISAGSGQLAFEAHGPAGATEFQGLAVVLMPRVGEMWADSVAVRVHGTWADSSLKALDALFVGRAMTVGPLLPRDVDLAGTWDGREAAVKLHSVADRDFGEDISVRYEPGPTRQILVLESANLRSDGVPYALAHPTTIEMGDRWNVGDFVLTRRGKPVLSANGGVEANGHVDFSARLDSIDVTSIMRQMGSSQLSGAISAHTTLTGTRAAPELEGGWSGQLAAGERKPATLDGTVSWKGPALSLGASFVQTPDQRLDVRGTLPIALELPRTGPRVTGSESAMSATLEARQFSLEWFEPAVPPRVASRLSGWLNGTLEAHGRSQSPELSGTLSLSQFEIQPTALGTRFDKGEASLRFAGNTAHLESASFHSGKGTLEVTGTATLGGPARAVFDVTMKARRFRVMNNAMAVVSTTGALTIRGPLRTPEVTGDLELLDTTVYLEGGTVERKVEPVTLTEDDQRELRRRFGLRKNVSTEEGAVASDSVTADVGVSMGSNVWARRHSDPIVSLEMEGKARARKQPGTAPTFEGEFNIETGRSYLSFIGRRFEITRAKVSLPGPVSEARAELSAQFIPSSANRSSGNTSVYAEARLGPAGATLDLRSEPYMSRADLINYLATGSTQGTMSSSTSAGLAMGTALGAVGGAAGRSLGFQVVQVTQDADGGQLLSAGNYVDPRLYLGFRQPVVQGQSNSRSSQGSTTETEFEVEYEAIKSLLVNVQGSSAEYRFLLRPRLKR